MEFSPWGLGFVLLCRFLLYEYGMVVDFFCSCEIDFDLMTFIYELDQYSLEIHQ